MTSSLLCKQTYFLIAGQDALALTMLHNGMMQSALPLQARGTASAENLSQSSFESGAPLPSSRC